MPNTDYITLAEARSTTLGAITAAGSSFRDEVGDDNAGVDRAILMACEEAVRRCKGLTETTGTVATNATTYTVDLTTVWNDFRPSRAVRFEFDFNDVEYVDYRTIARTLAGTAGTARPTQIGFRSPSEGYFNAYPGTSNPVLTVTYHEPFTAIVPGTTTPGTTQLNIPSQYIRPILLYGAAAHLEYYDANSRIPAGVFDRFNEYLRSLAGDVGSDTGVFVKNPNNYL